MHPESRGLINRRALLLIVAVAAIGAAVAAEMLAVRQKAPSSSQSRMSNVTSMSHPGGGHLYMQTNETRNAVVHYRWSASGTLTEAERVVTGGAGSDPRWAQWTGPIVCPQWPCSRPTQNS